MAQSKMFSMVDPVEHSVMGWGNRGWVEIVELILETCLNGALKTHIMYECNLNSRQVTQYIKFLADRKLIEGKQDNPDSKRHIYNTTELGKRYINAYKHLSGIFSQSVF
ncbi:MAG: hypothetical protein AUH25_06095 [Thaumarchaeota archaeon 13_1_40CM_38_12]|nr:MAG: hypothetical protein AUH25_06095 [Thaumarchaeota archaeon 13_1_40CM_38_12]OLC91247.1 MAG: hypothetical protein AUI92_08230 [Thaumarchaeota archaeon 13_1_40CM_3_38_6]TLY04337.1 MAG: hypothetical protein E6K87_03335 [Nitrososphaerota archaeon]TLY07348.1 MAG: hypothetical protein E6K83_05830 [Nitrososphaerota archaeon]